MAKTSVALARLTCRGSYIFNQPYNGRSDGKFRNLGDVVLRNPKALIGLPHGRIKEMTQDLPEGFQTSEFLLEHGLIDQIVDRHNLRDRLISSIGHWVMPPGRNRDLHSEKKTTTAVKRASNQG